MGGIPRRPDALAGAIEYVIQICRHALHPSLLSPYAKSRKLGQETALPSELESGTSMQ